MGSRTSSGSQLSNSQQSGHEKARLLTFSQCVTSVWSKEQPGDVSRGKIGDLSLYSCDQSIKSKGCREVSKEWGQCISVSIHVFIVTLFMIYKTTVPSIRV